MHRTISRFALIAVSAGLLALSGCGGGDEATTANLTSLPTSSSSCSSLYPDKMNTYSSRLSKYSGDVQCQSQIQAAESYRQAAIANCAAGSTSGATGNYSYYTQSLSIVNAMCR